MFFFFPSNSIRIQGLFLFLKKWRYADTWWIDSFFICCLYQFTEQNLFLLAYPNKSELGLPLTFNLIVQDPGRLIIGISDYFNLCRALQSNVSFISMVATIAAKSSVTLFDRTNSHKILFNSVTTLSCRFLPGMDVHAMPKICMTV